MIHISGIVSGIFEGVILEFVQKYWAKPRKVAVKLVFPRLDVSTGVSQMKTIKM
jgi:hypothetical protein